MGIGRKPRWTSEQIPDLAGRVAVVTGANSGIGLETARELARAGAHTILACRSAERGQRAVGDLRAEMPDSSVELMDLDLGSLSSIRGFAQDFAVGQTRLDMLINNAGIMAVPYSLTEDGFESQMGINHLGHFALTGRLLATPGARERVRVEASEEKGYCPVAGSAVRFQVSAWRSPWPRPCPRHSDPWGRSAECRVFRGWRRPRLPGP